MALALTTLSIELASGCSASEVSCSDVCSCQGKSGDASCIQACDQSHSEQKTSAKQAGCGGDYATLETCLADNSICDAQKKDLVVPISACGTQVTKLLDCEFPVMPTGSTVGSTTSGAASTGSSM